MSIALQVARETGTAAPLSALVREMIVSAETMFGPGSDYTEMAKWVERLVGDELKSGRWAQATRKNDRSSQPATGRGKRATAISAAGLIFNGGVLAGSVTKNMGQIRFHMRARKIFNRR